MIKANELRIGNLLYSNLTEINFICSSEDIYNLSMDCNANNANYVKLTEEWLLNAGFEKTDRYWSFTNDLKFLIELDIEGNYCLRVKLSKYLSAFICQVDFIHLLQNAMFVLRGEELVFSTTEP